MKADRATDATPPSRKASASRARKRAYAIHRWSGLISGANVLLLSVTGVILLVADEVEQLIGSEAEAQALSSKVAIDSSGFDPSLRALRAAHPDDEIAQLAFPADGSAPEFRVLRGDPEGDRTVVRFEVDSESGVPRELPERSEETFLRWVLRLHANLLLGFPGTVIVGVVGLFFLVSCVTGWIVHLPALRAGRGLSLDWVRWRRNAAVVTSDLHVLLGFSSLAFNSLLALTGVAITLGALLAQLWILGQVKHFEALYEGRSTRIEADLGRVYENARRTFPSGRIEAIVLPGQLQGDHHFLIFVESEGIFSEFLPTVGLAEIDASAEVSPLPLPWWVEAIAVAAPLHFGSFGGSAVRWVYALLGSAAGALSVTGGLLWLRRRRT